VLQVLLAIFVFVYNKDIQTAAFRGWDRIWSGRQVSNINSRVIDEIQTSIECCGSNSPLDYGLALPGSCCPNDSQYCNTITSYKTGCKHQIQYYIENSAQWIAYLSIVMAIFEVSGKLLKIYQREKST
jgi:hypothetical protein